MRVCTIIVSTSAITKMVGALYDETMVCPSLSDDIQHFAVDRRGIAGKAVGSRRFLARFLA